MRIHILIVVWITINVCKSQNDYKAAYITLDGDEQGGMFNYHIGTPEPRMSYVSQASFRNQIIESGWSFLTVKSNKQQRDVHQAYWSGYLETNLTYMLTQSYWRNTYELVKNARDSLTKELEDILKKNMIFMLNSAMHNKHIASWYQVYLHLWQLRGIQAAYNRQPVFESEQLTDHYLQDLQDETLGIYLLQLSGDMWTLLRLLTPKHKESILSPLYDKTPGPSNTLLFKVHNDSIIIGHVTGSLYVTMLRVFKRYEFPWKQANSEGASQVPGSTIVFTSYPSVTFSFDDFYMTNQNLVISETTLLIPNDGLFVNVLENLSNRLLTYIRIMAANRLATSGREWAKIFKNKNSGTFNNEWLVFDGKLFKEAPKKSNLPHGTLTMLVQLPDGTISSDVTQHLNKQTYFASFNIPFQKGAYLKTGLKELENLYKDGFYTRENTTRNLLFKNWHKNVTDLDTMMKLMRYNDYMHDPLSKINGTRLRTATKAISARRDLNSINQTYEDPNYQFYVSGGTDAKCVDMNLIEKLEMKIVCGPTYDDESIFPFSWSNISSYKLEHIPTHHCMQPEVFRFEPFVTQLGAVTVAAKQQQEEES